MNKDELVRKSYEALARAAKRPAKEQLQRLIAKGVIDEQGNVLLWNAFLYVVAVKPGTNGGVPSFHCVKPLVNNPGATEVDVSRDSLVQYVQEGQRVVTGYLDEKQNRWKEAGVIHLTPQGYLRTDESEEEQDHFGGLSEFQTVGSGSKA
jgi:hypothetical protein